MYLKIFTMILLISFTFAMEEEIINKKPITFMERLNKYKQKRENAFFDHTSTMQEQAVRYEKYTKKIGTMLSFTDPRYKNCKLRYATKAETQTILFLVAQTCDHYRGMPNPMENLYIWQNANGCKERMRKDEQYAKHMAVLTAAHAIRFAVINEQPHPFFKPFKNEANKNFEDYFYEQRGQKNIDPKFTNFVKDITININGEELHKDKTFSSLLDCLYDESWNNLVEQLGAVSDVIAPEIGFLDIPNVFEEDYKGWVVHKLISQYAVWGNIEKYKKVRKDFESIVNKNNNHSQTREFITCLTPSGVLLTTENKECFKEISDASSLDSFCNNGNTIALEYVFTLIISDDYGNNILQKDLFSFYLTRSINQHSLNHNLLSNINKEQKQQRVEDHQLKVEFLQRAINVFVHNKEQSLKYAEKANNLGALHHLLHYGKELESKGNLKEACQYYKIAANRGDKYAQNQYGSHINNYGNKTTKELMVARQYFKASVEKDNKNNVDTILNYAQYLEYGIGGPTNFTEALRYYKILINKGNAKAQYYYSRMLCEGKGCVINLKKAQKYCKMAVQQRGFAEAEYYYGLIKEKQDKLKSAIKYYDMAATHGYQPARYAYLGLQSKIAEQSNY